MNASLSAAALPVGRAAPHCSTLHNQMETLAETNKQPPVIQLADGEKRQENKGRARILSVAQRKELLVEFRNRGHETAAEFATRKQMKLKTLNSIISRDSKNQYRTVVSGDGKRAKRNSRQLSLDEQGALITRRLEQLGKSGAGLVEVRQSGLGPKVGLGLFMKKELRLGINEKDRKLFRYEGSLVPEKDIADKNFGMQYSRRRSIDSSEELSGFGRFLNHSETPNCEARKNEVDRTVDVYALENFDAKDELFIDYGNQYWRGNKKRRV